MDSEIFNKACDYLANREHSKCELKRKLRRKFPEASAEIDEALEYLEDKKLLDDRRFTEVFVRSKYWARNGPLKIRFDLKRKGVAKEIIDSELGTVDFDYFEQALNLVQIRYRREIEKYPKQERDDKEKFKAKMFGLLARRGYDYGVIKKVANELNL